MGPPDEEEAPFGAPSTSSPTTPHQEDHPEPTAIRRADKKLVRWCWQLDRGANRVTVWTGKLAAWATRRAMRRDQ